ncbi:MAG: FHA domain-containing protein [Lachnospiraceae bacterium]|nr:FHA domain-containing protein [Lachnospiraceae bacterium]
MEYQLLQDGTGNYLKIIGKAEETISDRIFSFQEIKGFLPMEIHWINGQKEAIYDISGCVSLAYYLTETVFTLADIQNIFFQLEAMIKQLTDYLLDNRGLVIHEDFLYIEKESGQVEGIFCPEAEKGDVKALGRLLEYIMEKMNQQDQELVFFVYGMHKLTKEVGVTPARLWEYVKNMKHEEISVPEKEGWIIYPHQDEKSSPPIKEKAGQPFLKEYLFPGVIALLGVGAFLFLWQLGFFRMPLSGQTDWKKTVGMAAFFLAVAGYGVWKTIPSRQEKRESDHVDYREEKEAKKACLIPCQGTGEPIPVTCFPFQIGRAAGKVNAFLSDQGISRIHAQILQEGGNIFVMDEESRNGTFRNNERLVPWQKTKLNDGDLLRLAGNEYVVEITHSEYVI